MVDFVHHRGVNPRDERRHAFPLIRTSGVVSIESLDAALYGLIAMEEVPEMVPVRLESVKKNFRTDSFSVLHPFFRKALCKLNSTAQRWDRLTPFHPCLNADLGLVQENRCWRGAERVISGDQ
jgi:hypothetical protein